MILFDRVPVFVAMFRPIDTAGLHRIIQACEETPEFVLMSGPVVEDGPGRVMQMCPLCHALPENAKRTLAQKVTYDHANPSTVLRRLGEDLWGPKFKVGSGSKIMPTIYEEALRLGSHEEVIVACRRLLLQGRRMVQ